jgi:hypothetical protein
MRKVFEQSGFKAEFDTINRAGVKNNKLLNKLAKSSFAPVLNYLLLTFITQDILIYN